MTLKGATMPTTHKHTEATLAEIREQTVWSLAHDAGCASPDHRDSPGARLLDSVRTAVLDLYGETTYDDAGEFWEQVNDRRWEISDGAPSIYTHTLWQQFVDLAAYNEDTSELGDEGGDLNKSAAIALYLIADRLADSLLGEIENAIEKDDAEDEDDEEGEV